MDYIVWPDAELSKVTGNPRRESEVHENLLRDRQQQLEQLREKIVGDVKLPESDRVLAIESISVLPGTGQLLISDRHIDIAKLKERIDFKLIEDTPLPKPMPVQSTSAAITQQAWHLSKINKPRTLTGAGIRVGVVDTGYDPKLPDLVAPFTAKFAEWQPAKPAQNTNPMMVTGGLPKDFAANLHGSMVCAFLAGKISGVAPGATVTVAAVPATSVLASQAQIVLALNWLLSLGQDIITTSLPTGVPGAVPPSGVVGPGPSLAAVEHALKQARTVHNILVTAAIGNIGTLGSFQHSGSSIQAFGVGAVNDGAVLFGSAWGSVAAGVYKPDIVAPGYQLHMPKQGGGFNIVGGTSFATPIVAGSAALLLEHDPTLRGDPVALAAKLATLVQPVKGTPPPNSTGAGLLDLSSL
jgi:subtilisin family serine protease